ncbi:MAG: MmcB family DNA repair protein [Rhizobiales bacterium]|nr:MmcB family DNA repair protein [Hyphomicrobiales bacterium]
MAGTTDIGSDTPAIVDGRQSARALQIQRGACRYLRALGFATVTELNLASGHRADIVALGRKGEIWIIEIKSSVEDFRSDSKWPAYQDHCDRLYFAVLDDLPLDILPAQTGIIVADRFGAAVIREAPDEPLAAARRKAVQLRFARAAALRLHALVDPDAASAAI